jgi:hypothetical protein
MMLPAPSLEAQVAVSLTPMVAQPPMIPLTLGIEALVADILPAVGRVNWA